MITVEQPHAPNRGFAYAGVRFELASPSTWELEDRHLPFLATADDDGSRPSVACAVDIADGPIERDRAVTWRWDGDRALVATRNVRATLHRLGRNRYCAEASVRGSRSVSSLVTALASAVISREGGLTLHACGVQIDGRAVLFVGPSGAGKSTAARHCFGSTCIAHDRAAIARSHRGFSAWGMVGGSPTDLPRDPRLALPLMAVLRVRHADGPSRVDVLHPAEAVATLRESVQTGGSAPADEKRNLEAIVALCEEVAVGVLHARLGDPLGDVVREFVGGRAP